jgi:hypothetical protein
MEPDEPSPGVRRLCAAVAGMPQKRVAAACADERFARLYVGEPADGEPVLLVAPPGVDEPALLPSIIRSLVRTLAPGPARTPALAVFHVGIVRLSGDGFGGVAVDRAARLVCDPALHAAAARLAEAGSGALPEHEDEAGAGGAAGSAAAAASASASAACLVVGLTNGLYADMRAEGLPGSDWQPAADASVYIRAFTSACRP